MPNETLSNIQKLLSIEYYNGTFFLNKLLNDVQDIESYKIVYHKPALTVGGLIQHLHGSLSPMKNFQESCAEPTVHLVDRQCFHANGQKHLKVMLKMYFVCSNTEYSRTNHS